MSDPTGSDDQIFPPRQRRRRQLDNLDDARRTLARITRAVERGRLKPDVANAMTNALRLLVKVFEAQDQEQKIAALEREVARLVAERQRMAS